MSSTKLFWIGLVAGISFGSGVAMLVMLYFMTYFIHAYLTMLG